MIELHRVGFAWRIRGGGIWGGGVAVAGKIILLMVQILHYLKGPKLREFWYIPYYG